MKNAKEKIWRDLIAFDIVVLVIILATFITTSFILAADITNTADLGDITHYNGLIFGDFESEKSDIEGALAIGGNALMGTAGQYDVGASAHHAVMGEYNNPNGYPTLLLNGLPVIGSNGGNESNPKEWFNVYGGSVAIHEDYYDDYTADGKVQFDTTHGVKTVSNSVADKFFIDAYSASATATSVLDNANDSAVTMNELKNSSFFSGQNMATYAPTEIDQDTIGSSNIIVVNVTDGGNVTISEPKIPSTFSSYDIIVFNFPNATGATFSGGSLYVDGSQINTSSPIGQAENVILKQYSEKVIWNFPVASQININGAGVVGSIMAPDSHVEAAGGSTNGMLIADSFRTTGSSELHSFTLSPIVFKLRPAVDEPETTTTVATETDISTTTTEDTTTTTVDTTTTTTTQSTTDETTATQTTNIPVEVTTTTDTTSKNTTFLTKSTENSTENIKKATNSDISSGKSGRGAKTDDNYTIVGFAICGALLVGIVGFIVYEKKKKIK